jgi:hypothetical protein
MPQDNDKLPNQGRFPPDLAAVLAPILLSVTFLYVTCATQWAKAFGDKRLFHLALWLGGVGSVLLFFARLPLYRQRRFFTLGPKSLTGVRRRLYYAAYWLILPSIALLVLLLFNIT